MLVLLYSASSSTADTIPNFWDPKAVADRPANIPDKIQFLSSDEHPPFVFRDPDGRLTGFHIDLARSLCEVLESSCSLRIVPFAKQVSALSEEEGDAIISGLARGQKAAEKMDFTDAYLKLPARFIVRADESDDFNPQQPSGKTVSVEAGSRHEAFALRFWPTAKILSYETAMKARESLKSGEADAHFGDGLSLSFWLRGQVSENCCRFSGGPWLEPGYFNEGLTIAVRKGDVERLEALNYALRQVYQNGTYRELYLRYFPLSFF